MELPLMSLVMFSPSGGYSISLNISDHVLTLYDNYPYDYIKHQRMLRLSLPSFMQWSFQSSDEPESGFACLSPGWAGFLILFAWSGAFQENRSDLLYSTPFSLSLADLHWLGAVGVNVHWIYPMWVKYAFSAALSGPRNTKLLSQSLSCGWMQSSDVEVFLFHYRHLWNSSITWKIFFECPN